MFLYRKDFANRVLLRDMSRNTDYLLRLRSSRIPGVDNGSFQCGGDPAYALSMGLFRRSTEEY